MKNDVIEIFEKCRIVTEAGVMLEEAVEQLRRAFIVSQIGALPNHEIKILEEGPVLVDEPTTIAPPARGKRGAWARPAKKLDKLNAKGGSKLAEKLKDAKPVKGRAGKIVEFLRANPGKEFNAVEIGKKIREDSKAVGMALSPLAKRGDIVKTRFGHYSIGEWGKTVPPVRDRDDDGRPVDPVQEAVREGVGESAAFQQGFDAHDPAACHGDRAGRNVYRGKNPMLEAAWYAGWDKRGVDHASVPKATKAKG